MKAEQTVCMFSIAEDHTQPNRTHANLCCTRCPSLQSPKNIMEMEEERRATSWFMSEYKPYLFYLIK